MKKGQRNPVADGPHRRSGQTSGQLIRPNVVVVWDKEEVQGGGPAEHPTPNQPRQLVQERVAGVPSAEDPEGHESVREYQDIAVIWHQEQAQKLLEVPSGQSPLGE